MKFRMNAFVQRMSQLGYRCIMCIRGAHCRRCECCASRL